jgi:hypothetical protein
MIPDSDRGTMRTSGRIRRIVVLVIRTTREEHHVSRNRSHSHNEEHRMVATTTTTGRRPTPFNPWLVVARILMLMTLAQAFFAGALLSGYTEGRDAHRINAYSLEALALVLLIASIATQRKTPAGRRMIAATGLFLVGIMVVATIGVLSAEGHRLLWLHVPAGVMMMGSAASLQAAARNLRQPADT